MDCDFKNKIEFAERKKDDGMKKLKYLLLALFTSGINLLAAAQTDPANVQMADTMRSNGKIYVVIAVILTILAGLVLYIVRLDRKISRLEKEK
jgi:CcmD family protein